MFSILLTIFRISTTIIDHPTNIYEFSFKFQPALWRVSVHHHLKPFYENYQHFFFEIQPIFLHFFTTYQHLKLSAKTTTITITKHYFTLFTPATNISQPTTNIAVSKPSVTTTISLLPLSQPYKNQYLSQELIFSQPQLLA